MREAGSNGDDLQIEGIHKVLALSNSNCGPLINNSRTGEALRDTASTTTAMIGSCPCWASCWGRVF